jgi:hypothetical protein
MSHIWHFGRCDGLLQGDSCRCYSVIDDPLLGVMQRRQRLRPARPAASCPFCGIYSSAALAFDSPKSRCSSSCTDPPRCSACLRRGRRHLEPASLRDQPEDHEGDRRRSHAARHVIDDHCPTANQVSQFYQGGTCSDTAARRKRLLAQCSQIPGSTYLVVTKGGTSVVRTRCI